jgi:hypothetical protein
MIAIAKNIGSANIECASSRFRQDNVMRFSIRLAMALVLMAGVVGCNRPVEEKTAATAAQPPARPPDTSSDR